MGRQAVDSESDIRLTMGRPIGRSPCRPLNRPGMLTVHGFRGECSALVFRVLTTPNPVCHDVIE